MSMTRSTHSSRPERDTAEVYLALSTHGEKHDHIDIMTVL